MKKAIIIIIIIGFVLLAAGKVIMIKTDNDANSMSINTDGLSSDKIYDENINSDIINEEFDDVDNIKLTLGLYSILIQEDSSLKNVQVIAKKPVILVNGIDVDKLEISCNNGTLTIAQNQKKNKFNANIFNFNDYKGELLIKIPAKTKLNSINIDNGVGKIELNNLILDALDIKCGTSQVVGKNLQMSNCSISGGTGSIMLKGILTDKIKVDSGTGSTYISGDILEKAEIDTGTNSVELELLGEEKDYDFEIETGLGKIEINKNNYKDEVKIVNNTDRKIMIETGTGSVKIKTK